MAEQNAAPAKAEPNADNAGTPTPDTKPVIPGNQPDTNGIDKQEPKKPEVEMIDVKGYKLPKEYHQDLKRDYIEEGKRWLNKEYTEAGRLKSDEEIESLINYKEMVSQLGDVTGMKGTIDRKKFDEFIGKQRADATEGLRKKLEASEKKKAEMELENQEFQKKVIQKQTRSLLTNAALEAQANPAAVSDFVDLLMIQGVVKLDEDLETPIVLNSEGQKAYSEDGNPLGLSDLMNRLRAEKPIYFEPAKTSGSGSQYGTNTNSERTGGPPHLRHALKPVYSIKSQKEVVNRRS